MPAELTFNFNRDIQNKILAMLLFAPERLGDAVAEVRPELFEHPALRDMAVIIQRHRRAHPLPMPLPEFEVEWGARLEDCHVPKEDYQAVHEQVLALRGEDFGWVAEHTMNFVQATALQNVLVTGYEEIRKSKKRNKPVDREKILLAIQSALTLQSAGDEIVVDNTETIEPEETRWLWPNRIALGKLTLIVGDPESGKSLFCAWMAARVSSGVAWPDCSVGHPPGKAIILQSEDGLADTVVPRLIQYEADRSKVFAVTGVRTTHGQDRMFSLLQDVVKLKKEIQRRGDVKLVIMDPIQGYFGGALSGKLNTNTDAHVRAVLGPLAAMAEETGVAVVGVSHLNKAAMMDAMYRVGGSIGIVAVARAVWLIKWDRDPDGMRYFQALKSNRKAGVPGLAFKIDRYTGDVTFHEMVVPSAADLLSPTFNEPGAMEAQKWLGDQLAAGPKNSKDLFDAGEQEGFSRGMLYRAKKALAVKTRRIGAEGRGAGHWEWSLW